MNDNNSNVIDLNKDKQGFHAILVPDGVHDVMVIGYNPDGTLYFGGECDELAHMLMLLSLAQRRVMAWHDRETDDMPDELDKGKEFFILDDE